MANRIRQNDKIKGIKTPLGREVKISQYADDTVLILDDSYSQGYFTNFAEAKKELKHFCNASCMKLNESKTEGMWLGASSITSDKYDFRYEPGGAKMKWVKPDQLLRSLGTRLTIAGDTTEFWKEKVEKIIKRLNNWRNFYPSLIGKILISKLSLYSCTSLLIIRFAFGI